MLIAASILSVFVGPTGAWHLLSKTFAVATLAFIATAVWIWRRPQHRYLRIGVLIAALSVWCSYLFLLGQDLGIIASPSTMAHKQVTLLLATAGSAIMWSARAWRTTTRADLIAADQTGRRT